MLKKIFPKKKKGVTETMLGSLIAIFVVLVVTFTAVVDLQTFYINLQLHQVDRQASLRMETDGGLTEDTKQYIIDSLSKMKGFDASRLKIKASNTADNHSPNPTDDKNYANYGEPISLALTYNYTPTKHHLIGWTQVTTEKGNVIPITVHWDTTSKGIRTVTH
ncbi:hypothetical protein [Clostridium ljungdahlii]|uniref:Uncharacterized protein n=1 Tax=Clostridium ljungdahlii TaxID=1538 RepID=A0A162L9X5_9CLOT|nr:hypothetical protein [Clostridium ljungdahlii]OAA90746.1 hypothetical protein WY13_01050 [Clostridium ljungdahlii]